MNFLFRWRFTGLCLFVPRYDIERQPNKNEMKVLLVDAMRLQHAYHVAEYHEPHLPVLVCYSKDVVERSREPDAYYQETLYDGKVGASKAVFYLDDQDLSLANPKPKSLDVTYRKDTGVCCSNDGSKDDQRDDDSFAWVAPLAKISPGSEDVRPSCFSKRCVDPSVISRVTITEGRIHTLRMAMDDKPEVLSWTFEEPGKPRRVHHVQSLADIVEVQQSRRQLALKTTLLRRPRNRRVAAVFDKHDELLIKLEPKHKKDEVEVWVENMPWPDITDTRPILGQPRFPDYHFVHFYDLSHSYQEANVPHPFAGCGYPDRRHQGRPTCPPAQGAPYNW